MSVKVPLSELPTKIVERGAGYLLTSVQDSRTHVMHSHFEVAAAESQVQLRCDPGNTARGNVAQQGSVTVLWPASVDSSYSLIVDGEARVDGDHVIVVATSAVLHRPAPLPEAPA